MLVRFKLQAATMRCEWEQSFNPIIVRFKYYYVYEDVAPAFQSYVSSIQILFPLGCPTGFYQHFQSYVSSIQILFPLGCPTGFYQHFQSYVSSIQILFPLGCPTGFYQHFQSYVSSIHTP